MTKHRALSIRIIAILLSILLVMFSLLTSPICHADSTNDWIANADAQLATHVSARVFARIAEQGYDLQWSDVPLSRLIVLFYPTLEADYLAVRSATYATYIDVSFAYDAFASRVNATTPSLPIEWLNILAIQQGILESLYRTVEDSNAAPGVCFEMRSELTHAQKDLWSCTPAEMEARVEEYRTLTRTLPRPDTDSRRTYIILIIVGIALTMVALLGITVFKARKVGHKSDDLVALNMLKAYANSLQESKAGDGSTDARQITEGQPVEEQATELPQIADGAGLVPVDDSQSVNHETQEQGAPEAPDGHDADSEPAGEEEQP